MNVRSVLYIATILAMSDFNPKIKAGESDIILLDIKADEGRGKIEVRSAAQFSETLDEVKESSGTKFLVKGAYLIDADRTKFAVSLNGIWNNDVSLAKEHFAGIAEVLKNYDVPGLAGMHIEDGMMETRSFGVTISDLTRVQVKPIDKARDFVNLDNGLYGLSTQGLTKVDIETLSLVGETIPFVNNDGVEDFDPAYVRSVSRQMGDEGKDIYLNTLGGAPYLATLEQIGNGLGISVKQKTNLQDGTTVFGAFIDSDDIAVQTGTALQAMNPRQFLSAVAGQQYVG